MSEVLKAIECDPGDEFLTRGKTWTHCGYYSAVPHVAALGHDGERKVIPHVEQVVRIKRGTVEDAKAACEKHGIPWTD